MLLLGGVVVEEVSEKGLQCIEKDHVGVLHFTVVELAVNFLNDLVVLHLIELNFLALEHLGL